MQVSDPNLVRGVKKQATIVFTPYGNLFTGGVSRYVEVMGRLVEEQAGGESLVVHNSDVGTAGDMLQQVAKGGTLGDRWVKTYTVCRVLAILAGDIEVPHGTLIGLLAEAGP